jgi:hypothetical protein
VATLMTMKAYAAAANHVPPAFSGVGEVALRRLPEIKVNVRSLN